MESFHFHFIFVLLNTHIEENIKTYILKYSDKMNYKASKPEHRWKPWQVPDVILSGPDPPRTRANHPPDFSAIHSFALVYSVTT